MAKEKELEAAIELLASLLEVQQRLCAVLKNIAEEAIGMDELQKKLSLALPDLLHPIG